MWFSFLDTPSSNLRYEHPASYECQILISWPYKDGLNGKQEPLEAPAADHVRTSLIKSLENEE